MPKAKENGPAKVTEEDNFFDAESSGGELYKFDAPGQTLKGLIVEKRDGKTNLGDATFYTINTGKEEVTFVPTKALKQDLDKYYRQFGGAHKTLVEIEFVEEKKGSFPNPFKVFKVRAGTATEARLAGLGISIFDEESSSEGGE